MRLNTRSAWLAVRKALSGLRANFIIIIGGYALFVFGYVGLLVVFGLLRDFLAYGPAAVNVIQLVLLQAFVFLMIWIKFSRFAFLLIYFRENENIENRQVV